MLLGPLAASKLGNLLIAKNVIDACKRTSRASKTS